MNTWQATVLAVLMSVVTGSVQALTGSGTQEDPWLIQSLADFDEFAGDDGYWSGHISLHVDVDLSGRVYDTAVIAPDTDNTTLEFEGTPFGGVFRGNNHVIQHLTIDPNEAEPRYVGLFGTIEGSAAQVDGLGIENAAIACISPAVCVGTLAGLSHGTISNCYATGSLEGDHYVGGLVGESSFGTISHCHTAVSITGSEAGNDWIGGLVGNNHSSIVSDSYSTGSVTGNGFVGGLVGYNLGEISFCYASGPVEGNDNVGGLCGWNAQYIGNCYTSGSVTGTNWVGGLIGHNSYGSVSNCYATGSVEASSFVGGLVGYTNGGIIITCYSMGVVTGDMDPGAFVGVNEGTVRDCYVYLLSGPDNGTATALDDLQMQDSSHFVAFDFAGSSDDGEDDYWTITNGYCPRLSWQTDDGPVLPSPPATTLSGRGYPRDPYKISSYADFVEFRTNRSLRCGYFVLEVDIDLAMEAFTTSVVDGTFGGHFDGKGHAIKNITILTGSYGRLGLFGRMDHGSLHNLTLENVNITGSGSIGGFCGFNYGSLRNCHISGAITTEYTSSHLGGLCGTNFGRVSECSVDCVLNDRHSAEDAGGICGRNYGPISKCFARGSIAGGLKVGGVCGFNYTGSIDNCYSTMSVTGGRYVGGLCGRHYSTRTTKATITNCYSAGPVEGDQDVGGLVGDSYYGKTTYSFWDTQASGLVGSDGGTGKTTAEMKMLSTFLDAGWDFTNESANGTDDLWRLCIDGTDYPRLAWEFGPDYACPDGVSIGDLLYLSNRWLERELAPYTSADRTGDGAVNLDDYGLLSEQWLQQP